MDGWLDGRMEEHKDGWLDRCKYVLINGKIDVGVKGGWMNIFIDIE